MSAFRSSGDLAADRRYLWGDASRKDGDQVGAADLFRQAIELAPYWPSGWFALGEVLAAAGDSAAARAAFTRCLALEPADVLGAGARLARIEGRSSELPAAYVAGLFDEYAPRFDDHLTGALAYRGPAVLIDAIGRQCVGMGREMRFERVADLGCGTGLMAQALGPRAGIVDGVDLSPRMLTEAAKRGLYRRLVASDVVEFLAETPERYDLIVAADVLVYLGDLMPLFAAVRHALADAGLFAFTVQAEAGTGYSLGADMRFAHSEAYLARIAAEAGLKLRLIEAVSTRQDAGRDVPGLVAVLTR